VDNNAIADGFQIYLHSFVVTSAGEWVVVQQGLNDRRGMARRYHWHSASVRDFVAEPHTGIVGEHQGTIMNLVDAHARPAQTALLEVVREHPEKTLRAQHPPPQPGDTSNARGQLLLMPLHHEVRAENVDLKRLGGVLAVAYERDLHDFAELLLLESLGPRTLQSLALIAELVHGTPCRFSDPARFSFAHGGKDGHPFPVPLKTYDQSLTFLRTSLDRARVGDRDKLDGFRRLERFARLKRNVTRSRLRRDGPARSAVARRPDGAGREIDTQTSFGRHSVRDTCRQPARRPKSPRTNRRLESHLVKPAPLPYAWRGLRGARRRGAGSI
jgi:hypothetical protein